MTDDDFDRRYDRDQEREHTVAISRIHTNSRRAYARARLDTLKRLYGGHTQEGTSDVEDLRGTDLQGQGPQAR